MKIKLAIFTLLSTLSQISSADTKDFSGFTLGANLNSVNTTVQETYASNEEVGKYGESNYLGSLQAGYTWALSDKSTLGIGASYVFGNLKAGAKVVGEDEYKGKGHYAVYIEPGYVVGDSTLLYGKLGYAAMNGYDIDDGDASEKVKVHGAIYGVGVRKTLSDNLFLQLEFTHSNFGSKTESPDPTDDILKFKVNQAAIGLGLRF